MILSSITSAAFMFFGYLILFYMFLVIGVYTSMLIVALFQLKKELKLDRYIIDSESLEFVYSKPVSIIVSAFNEEVGILDTIQSLLTLNYPQVEIIIVNDGSTDSTEEQIIKGFQMYEVEKVVQEHLPTMTIQSIYQSTSQPNLILVTKDNGGKADALNAGINISKYPYFCSIDGDSILDSTSLLRIMKPMISSDDEVIAAGGTVRIANGFDIQLGTVMSSSLSSNKLVIMQVIEYMRAFLMGRIALSKFNLVLIISGAFSVFSKKWVIDAGGYSTKTIGEDMELVVKLHRLNRERKSNKKIVFIPDPVCWTEAPETLSDLRKQRRRWHQGLAESLWKHKKMIFNPKYGPVGLVSIPYFWFIELLGPVIELLGYAYIVLLFLMGEVYYEFAILLSLLFILYGSLFSMVSVLLETWSRNTYTKPADILKILLLSVTEVFWYRPLTIIWRCEGIVAAIFRRKAWGTLTRKGF
ncbi:glycosyltransferase [Sporosarcina siberiensis]|uniref:Glycosyltransferase n=1 Tax=Sporosarcina siberiensis TaxID=1365606 RepID=A0ABW4SH18_9BACL